MNIRNPSTRERWRLGDKFKTNLVYIERPCLINQTNERDQKPQQDKILPRDISLQRLVPALIGTHSQSRKRQYGCPSLTTPVNGILCEMEHKLHYIQFPSTPQVIFSLVSILDVLKSHLCVYLCGVEGVRGVCVEGRGPLRDSVLSSHHVGPWAEAQVSPAQQQVHVPVERWSPDQCYILVSISENGG